MSFTPGRVRYPPQSYGGSRGGRVQRPQYPRSARNTPFASYDGWGSPPSQGLYPVDELGPTTAPGPGPGGWETGRTHPEEYHHPGYEDEFQQTPFHGLPRDLQLDDSGWGRTQGDWYGWGGADADRRGYSDLPRSFVDDSDALRSRIRWRDELLTGDPQKVMDEHAAETSTLVISFVTRGSPSHPHGQGDEILFFKPRPKDANRYQLQRAHQASWNFLFIEATPIIPLGSDEKVPATLDLSKDSIAKALPDIDPSADLRLVRRSKPLRWDESTFLESFLYRVADGKEDIDSEASKELDFRLGHGLHYWTQLTGFQNAVESDVVSTAMVAVCLPPALSLGVDNILADMHSRSEELALQALDVMYLTVQAGFARDAFRFYPIPPPINNQTELEIVAKRRVWAYWSEVAAWHIGRVRPDAQISIMYTLTKTLSVIKNSVDDPKVSIAELDKIFVNAIAAEGHRLKGAAKQLIKEGVAEILHNPSFQIDKPSGDKALENMHIFTTSSSSTVYHVLAKLITHVLSKKGSPGPASLANRRVMSLKITIAESRPLQEGVQLAMSLDGVINSYAKYKEKTAEINRRNSAPSNSGVDLGPSAIDPELQTKLREMLGVTMSPFHKMKDGTVMTPGRQMQVLGLTSLLAEMESKKTVEEPKVSIEVITDAAFASSIFASSAGGARPVVLLGADRVLPNGDVVNKTGSCPAAWAGKAAGGVVLILTRSDRIHPTNLSAPAKPDNAGTELVPSWKATFGTEKVDGFVGSPNLTIKNALYDEVAHEHVTAYITDIGLMEREMLIEAVNLQSDLLHHVGLT